MMLLAEGRCARGPGRCMAGGWPSRPAGLELFLKTFLYE
eukprot:COSAG01_NODE_2013_length_8643_cov_30.224081_2_plen_39_part_00